MQLRWLGVPNNYKVSDSTLYTILNNLITKSTKQPLGIQAKLVNLTTNFVISLGKVINRRLIIRVLLCFAFLEKKSKKIKLELRFESK